MRNQVNFKDHLLLCCYANSGPILPVHKYSNLTSAQELPAVVPYELQSVGSNWSNAPSM